MENNTFAGKAQGRSQRITMTSSSFENALDTSVDLFASEADCIGKDMDDDIKHIVTITHSASSQTERMRRPGGESGSSALCASNQNIIPAPVMSRATDHMFLKILHKLNDKIDRNAGDFEQRFTEHGGRIEELERKFKIMEDEKEMKLATIIAAAAATQEKPSVLLPDPVQVVAPPSQKAPKGRCRTKPCAICGKVLSVPYVYKHQKEVHPLPKTTTKSKK